MYNFGPLFKKFREEKWMSTTQVAEDIVSVQFLRRFEKGENDIKLSNFYKLLSRINISYEEFMTYELSPLKKDTIENFEKTLDHLSLTNDYLEIKKQIDYYNDKYLQTKETKYLHYSILARSFSNRMCRSNYIINIEIILEYLEKIDVWSKHEFFIANYCTGDFSDEQLKSFSKIAFLYVSKSVTTRSYQADYILHLGLELLERNLLEELEELIINYKQNEQTKKILQYLSYNTFLVYLEGLLMIRKGDKKGIEQCENLIKFFSETINYKEYSNAMYHSYLKHYSKSLLAQNKK